MLLDGHSTERLQFRKVIPSDFDLWLPFYEDPQSTQFWQGIPKDNKTACTQQFEWIFERYRRKLGGQNAMLRKEDNTLVGLCGLLLQEIDGKKEWEIGYSLLPEHRGYGYATEAATYCKDIAFKEHLADSLISIIQIDNEPSQKVAIKNGMTRGPQTTYKDNPVYIYRVHRPDRMKTRS